MPPLSIIAPSSKVFKDCFLSTVEYVFVSVPAQGQNPQEEVKKKVKVLHEVHHLEALLMWRSTFEEIKTEKGWGPQGCFRNALLLLGGDAKDKWIACVAVHLGNNNATAVRFTNTMKGFMLEFCSRNDTEKTREMLLSARKPSSLGIRDFVARIKQLNRFMEYLPEPLNDRLDEDEITAIIRRSVPDWNDSLVRSARPMASLQDLTSYYQDLEELEVSRNNRNRNRNNNNRDRGGQQQERDMVARRQGNHRREVNYAERGTNNNYNNNTNNNNDNRGAAVRADNKAVYYRIGQSLRRVRMTPVRIIR